MSAAGNTITFILLPARVNPYSSIPESDPVTYEGLKQWDIAVLSASMKLVVSYRKEDSVVAILIIIIIIQWLGVRMKRKRKPERKGNSVCPMAKPKHAHLTD